MSNMICQAKLAGTFLLTTPFLFAYDFISIYLRFHSCIKKVLFLAALTPPQEKNFYFLIINRSILNLPVDRRQPIFHKISIGLAKRLAAKESTVRRQRTRMWCF